MTPYRTTVIISVFSSLLVGAFLANCVVVSADTGATKTVSINTGLKAADYYAAGQACAAYEGKDVAKDLGPAPTLLSGAQDKNALVRRSADAARDAMFAAAIWAVGVDPATCMKHL